MPSYEYRQAKRRAQNTLRGDDSKPKFDEKGDLEAAKKRAEDSLNPKRKAPMATDLIEGKERLKIILSKKKAKEVVK